MKLKKGFITHEIMGEQLMVAAGPAAKLFHGIVRSNETAAFIVDCLKKDTTEQAIVEALLEAYEVDLATAQRGVAVILQKLRSISALDEG